MEEHRFHLLLGLGGNQEGTKHGRPLILLGQLPESIRERPHFLALLACFLLRLWDAGVGNGGQMF